MPKFYPVTVIVSYVPGEDVQKCLVSLQSQTLKEMEVIIVADGLADENHDEVLNYFLQNNSNFRIVRNEKNMGKEYSRKRGISEAKGEYIGFLDKDTCANHDAFEKLYISAKRFNCEIALADYHDITENNNLNTYNEINSQLVKIYSGRDFFDFVISMIKKPFYLRTDWLNKIFKKDLFVKEQSNLLHPAINEETITLSASLASERVVVIDERLITTNTQKNTYCRAKAEQNIEKFIYSADFFKKYLLDIGMLDAFYEKFLNFFYYYIFNKNVKFSLSLEKKEADYFLNKLINKINDNLNIKKDFYRYINNKERNNERLLFSTINNNKYYSILKVVEETEVYFRKDGGKRLKDRSKYIINHRKMVTIVTICKEIFKANRKAYFDKMLSTVANQTYGRENIEHIVIDGDSTDETVEYLDLLSHNGIIDYWISEKDSGVYNAMNKGVKHSFGEYIIFMNTDDYFAESAIEDLVKAIEVSNTDYAFSNAIIIDEKDNHIGRHVGDINRVYYGSPYCHQTLLCKASCFTKVRFDESFKITMWSYAISLVTTGFEGTYINKNLAFFRFGGISTNSSHVVEFKNEQTKIRNEVVIPMLGIDQNEYDFLHHHIKDLDTEGIKIDMKGLHKKLLKMASSGNEFQKRFSESTLRLINIQIN